MIKTQFGERCDRSDYAMIMLILVCHIDMKSTRKLFTVWANMKDIDRWRLAQTKICGHTSFHSVTLINVCLIKQKLIAQWLQLWRAIAMCFFLHFFFLPSFNHYHLFLGRSSVFHLHLTLRSNRSVRIKCYLRALKLLTFT